MLAENGLTKLQERPKSTVYHVRGSRDGFRDICPICEEEHSVYQCQTLKGWTSPGSCLLSRRRNSASIVWGVDTHAIASILSKTVLVDTTLFCIGSRMILLLQQVLICQLMVKPTEPEQLILKDLQRSPSLGRWPLPIFKLWCCLIFEPFH